jgi:hypothetical protein
MLRQDTATPPALAAWTPNYGGQADFAFDDTQRYVALAGGWQEGWGTVVCGVEEMTRAR